MTARKEKTETVFDRKHEALVERNRKKFQEAVEDTIYYNFGPEDNVPLQVMNQVLQEQAKKKVN